MMPETKHITSLMPYASSSDFHRIFYEENDSLHRLSFLLTADREKAEQCFVPGLQESVNGSPVFKEWAHAWARRTVIQNAVRVINPRPVKEHAPSSSDGGGGTTLAVEQVETAAVLQLEPFERFVYVISVLERCSDLDCSVLLGCPGQDVIAANSRIRANRKATDFRLTGTVNGKTLNRASTGNL